MSDRDEQRQAFTEKVKQLYVEHFGDDAFMDTDDGEPVLIGPLLLLMEQTYLSGETGIIVLYTGSYNSTVGMAQRYVVNAMDYRSDE